ncbi:MAG: helix-turn-helix transcriptional regulator [Mucilaginibacter sp.]|uniref:helix-turn-helix domain-containing protein n=1 Tax=Mucilaginibacter sp. TaxID=1882438 RepID=UPI0031A815AE
MNEEVLHVDLKDDENVWMPGEIGKDVKKFNVFYVKHNQDDRFNCKPFNRKALYKISLLKGKTVLYYADKTIEFNSGLLFTNPDVPYSWEHLETDQVAYFCIFTEDFFDQFVNIKGYPVFKPGQTPFFHLDEDQFATIEAIFKQMLGEITLEFIYKYDSLRALVLQLVYAALKLEPAKFQTYAESNGSQRIASVFKELLERQFPIESTNQRMAIRHPAKFADFLSVHVNHLNHAIKQATGKTTTQLISERIMQEARALLQHTDWNISEIAWCLGFDDLPHFINFFKRNQHSTPKIYRKNQGM